MTSLRLGKRQPPPPSASHVIGPLGSRTAGGGRRAAAGRAAVMGLPAATGAEMGEAMSGVSESS